MGSTIFFTRLELSPLTQLLLDEQRYAEASDVLEATEKLSLGDDALQIVPQLLFQKSEVARWAGAVETQYNAILELVDVLDRMQADRSQNTVEYYGNYILE